MKIDKEALDQGEAVAESHGSNNYTLYAGNGCWLLLQQCMCELEGSDHRILKLYMSCNPDIR